MSTDGLPSYDDLKDMYLAGWTYQDLAAEYGCARSTVFRKIKEGALAAGEFPLRPALSRAERIQRTRAGRCRDDLEDSSALAIRLEISIADYPGTRVQWCTEHGLRYTTVCEILRGAKPKVTRQLAARLQAALQPNQPGLRLVHSADQVAS